MNKKTIFFLGCSVVGLFSFGCSYGSMERPQVKIVFPEEFLLAISTIKFVSVEAKNSPSVDCDAPLESLRCTLRDRGYPESSSAVPRPIAPRPKGVWLYCGNKD